MATKEFVPDEFEEIDDSDMSGEDTPPEFDSFDDEEDNG